MTASPSALSNGGADFGVWLRAVPLTYTSGFAGYTDSIGPFRFISTTMTVPPARTPDGSGGTALVGLGHSGGAASISYASNDARGAFTVNPAPSDQVSVSIYYDQDGHFFTVTVITLGTTQTVTIAAPYADSMPLNSAQVAS